MVNDHRWFPLLVRAIGLFGLVSQSPSLVGLAYSLAMSVTQQRSAWGPSDPWQLVVSAVYVAIPAALSVYLLAGAPKLVAFLLRDARGRCPRCDYDLAAVVAEICPECGRPIDREQPRPAPPQEGRDAP